MPEARGIEFSGVSKSYRRGDQDVPVLNGVSLKIAPGDFVALMGPSGSGKSTLLNLIAGLDDASTGSIKVGNSEISPMSSSARCAWRSRHVGFIFQRYHLLEVLNAAQNVEVPLLLFGLSAKERKRRVNTTLQLVGIADRAKHFPRQLSGGQEQRVAIARALVTDPSVIVADEPTGDLDTRSADEIMDLITLANQQLGKTVVMVTHDPKMARRAKRILSLEKGRIGEAQATRELR